MEWKDKIITYVIENGPKLLGGILILVAGVLAARYVGRFILAWLNKIEMEPPVRTLIVRVAKLLVVLFAGIIALGTMGFNVMALVTGIGVIGVGISLATQGVLSNLVAGLVIIFVRPFRVGEYVDMLGEEGVVESIELFSTTLSHPDRSRVVIPNRKIVGEVLHNYGTIRQLDLAVGVSYDTNITEAMAIVKEILRDNPRVLKELTPGIGISSLGDSSVNLAVRPWVKVGDFGPAGAEIYQSLLDRFRTRGIEMPFPQREIRIVNGEHKQAAVA